jgi:hypothetical protein
VSRAPLRVRISVPRQHSDRYAGWQRSCFMLPRDSGRLSAPPTSMRAGGSRGRQQHPVTEKDRSLNVATRDANPGPRLDTAMPWQHLHKIP